MALLSTTAAPWLLQIPPTENATFSYSLSEPSTAALMLIGCATLIGYGIVLRLREQKRETNLADVRFTPTRRAA